MTTVYAIHDVDDAKLQTVIEQMKQLGAPTIRVVDCGDYYQALEGSHRLAAAAKLDIEPNLEILDQVDPIEITEFDWYEKADWYETTLPAGEVAGELFSPQQAVVYEF